MVKHTTARGCAPLENFWNLEALRLLLRPFLHEPIYAAWKPDNRVHKSFFFSHCLQPSHIFQYVTYVLESLAWASAKK